MSPSETSADSYKPVSVDLRCSFPGADVLLIDGHQRLVGHGVQQLRVAVQPGIYTARVRVAEASSDKPIVVRPGTPFESLLDAPVSASPIPLRGWAKSHEYHQDAARRSTDFEVALDPLADASVFIMLREWTSDGAGLRASGPMARELILRSVDGVDLYRFETDAPGALQQDRAVAQGVRVAAGFYRLVTYYAGTVVELPIYALSGWQTQVFLLSQSTSDGPAPDFSRASIIWTRLGTPFDPDRWDLGVYESLRVAADSGQHQITDQGLAGALYEKFDNPMLGLVSAHALRERGAIDDELLATVTRNLEGILGSIPDVLALKLALNPAADVGVVNLPPMLRTSWDILLQHSVQRPELVRSGSLAARVGSSVIGRGVWMAWIADPMEAPGDMSVRTTVDIPAAARRALLQTNQSAYGQPLRLAKRSEERSSLTSRALESVAAPGLERVVRMYGVPRSVIDEAPAPFVNAIPQSTTGGIPMDLANRRQFNERFLQRLKSRHPEHGTRIEEDLQRETVRLGSEFAAPAALALEAARPMDLRSARDLALETIVSRERPVLFVKDEKFDTDNVALLGPDAVDLLAAMKQSGDRLVPLLPLIGRIDVVNFPGSDFVGTGWFVDTDIVVTNRHVAALIARWDGRKFAFIRGIGGRPYEASLSNAHEFDDLAADASRVFMVTEVLYIEPESGPNDIAFLRVRRRTDGRGPAFIEVAPTDAANETPVCVIGYPARASKRVIPDQALMKDLYQDRYDVKRAAPGYVSGTSLGSTTHDCTTLGGNSGSVLIDLATGRAVGLHYAGIYQEDNFAVRASVLNDYIRRKRWNAPSIIESPATPLAPLAPPPGQPDGPARPAPSRVDSSAVGRAEGGDASHPLPAGSVSITIPLTITVSLGAPLMGASMVLPRADASAPAAATGTSTTKTGIAPPAPERVTIARVEEVLPQFWDLKLDGVVAARVGFSEKDGSVGDEPCIAASVRPANWALAESAGPSHFKGVPVRYFPADLDEQVQSLPRVESVDTISYDDDARTGARFSFDPVDVTMDAILHVGPEYSWEVLKQFLDEAQGRLVSAMYEFHAPHIKDALEERLQNGGSLSLVLDNATFAKLKPNEGFDRVGIFEDWAGRFPFARVVAPEGTGGLISDSYHIKVTVRDDDKFWLSSGNWKAGSSQPIITQAQRDNASVEDLPGNREWHVVIKNKALATRFRNHILQDFARSQDLGGGPVSRSLMTETLVDVPMEEAVEFERRPPSEVLAPLNLRKRMRVRPLLTPDRQGAIYSEAVLELIESASSSLLFQIPYIGMPPNPREEDRGYIDALIKALTHKLKTLSDARVLLRVGGQKFSAPMHAAWYFKSKGVDIDSRVRVIEDHHTKGMIVDGKRILLGSHNWSKPGVSLNRDASLLFDDEQVAQYFTRAFEIDWARSNRVRPKQFVRPEAVVLEAVGDAPPPGFRRVRLSDLAKDE